MKQKLIVVLSLHVSLSLHPRPVVPFSFNNANLQSVGRPRAPIAHPPAADPRVVFCATTGSKDTNDEEEHDILSASPQSPQERMLQWAKDQPDADVSPSLCVVVRPPSEGGAGIFALDDIPFNETLAVLPFDGPNYYDGSVDTGAVFKLDAKTGVDLLNDGPVKRRILELVKGGSKGSLSSALTGIIAHLHLVKLREVREVREATTRSTTSSSTGTTGTSRSRIGPFLDVLPLLPSRGNDIKEHPFPNHVLFWTDDEISLLLANTLALTKAQFARAQAGEAMGALSSAFVTEHCPTNNMQEIMEAKDAIVSAFACVQSRTFEGFNITRYSATDDDKSTGGSLMIPFLDLLNHASDDQRNARHAIDDDRNAAVLLTDRDIKKGEEILINYGRRESWDWGTKYAFVPHQEILADAKPDSITVALPLFPRVILNSEGVEVDLTSKGTEGIRAANAIRVALGAINEADSDPLMLADLFLPQDHPPSSAPLSSFPAKQICVIITATSESDKDTAFDNVKSRAMPIFRAAEYIIRTLYKGGVIDEDVVCSFTVGLLAAGDEDRESSPQSDEDVNRYIMSMARHRRAMLQVGLEKANAWASSSLMTSAHNDDGDCEFTSLRKQLANDMRHAELSAVSEFIEYLQRYYLPVTGS